MQRIALVAFITVTAFGQQPISVLLKKGVEVDTQSLGRLHMQQVKNSFTPNLTGNAQVLPPKGPAPVLARGTNTMVNNPNLDFIQIFPGAKPILAFNQSESTVAARERGGVRTIVTAYNTEAGARFVESSN